MVKVDIDANGDLVRAPRLGALLHRGLQADARDGVAAVARALDPQVPSLQRELGEQGERQTATDEVSGARVPVPQEGALGLGPESYHGGGLPGDFQASGPRRPTEHVALDESFVGEAHRDRDVPAGGADDVRFRAAPLDSTCRERRTLVAQAELAAGDPYLGPYLDLVDGPQP